MKIVLPVLFLILIPNYLGKASHQKKFITWNVGQGLWTTFANLEYCVHFDAGGEKPAPLDQIIHLCGHKRSIIFLSHWDWDHRRFVNLVQKNFANTCFWQDEILVVKNAKIRTQELAPKCFPELVAKIKNDTGLVHILPSKKEAKTANATSQIAWLTGSRILLPGDAPKSSEKRWQKHITVVPNIWILGHHGSKTSSSQQLVQIMRNHTQAIVSARKEKYGHPHTQVMSILRQRKIPTLLTEDWGHLIFNLEN